VTDPVSIIRAIVRDELSALRLPEIAVVTSAFPHTEAGDAHNFECSVKLREGALELRKVPMATPHIGMASPPRAGELVLIAYVGGDPNRPIVVGRLYSDEANPPLHAEGEWRLEQPAQGQPAQGQPAQGTTSIAIDKDSSVVLTAGKTVMTLKKDGALEVTGEADLKIDVKGKVEVTCTDATIDASGTIELGKGGSGVITEQSHRCYFTGKPLKPSQTVKAKG
jgi:phage baseplate assembly protein gpV